MGTGEITISKKQALIFAAIILILSIYASLIYAEENSQKKIHKNKSMDAKTEASPKWEKRLYEPDENLVRCAVIGGMVQTTDLWKYISEMFEEETGIKVVVVLTATRPYLAETLRNGEVDLLTMHSGDITTNLVADGYGMEMKPWTRNNLVIAGPIDDPAGISGMTNGAAALQKIADSGCRLMDVRSMGAREVGHTLFKGTTVESFSPEWVVMDTRVKGQQVLQFARKNNAYVIVGRMPIVQGKMNSYGMRICVVNDPVMCRPYNVMVANPDVNPTANVEGARKLSEFLTSKKVQDFLANNPKNQVDGIPLFFPVGKPIDKVVAGIKAGS